MIYPSDFEETIGFVSLREQWKRFARFESAVNFIDQVVYSSNKKELNTIFNEMEEWELLIANSPSVSQWSGLADVTAWIKKAEIENYYFEEEELLHIGFLAENHDKIARAIKNKEELFPHLKQKITEVAPLEQASALVRSIVDKEGVMLPYASAVYGKLGNEIKKLETEARKITRHIFRNLKDLGYTAELDVTVREERLVIPILAEYKRKVNGFVKDVSATGKILYIEPVESLELNNLLTEYHAERKREREKILRIATAQLRILLPSIVQAMNDLVYLDVLWSRVQMGQWLEARRVEITSEKKWVLKNAINPGLWIKHKQEKNKVVPLYFSLDENVKMAVISGPNAGGKSVALKTAFLMSYMTQMGLRIPADPGSVLPLFEGFAIDMGDAQSSEDDLSTYSAHLKKLKWMQDHSSQFYLMGMDELGSGTDPRFGGPIAQAVLEKILEGHAFSIITTHFSRLKEWAQSQSFARNDSMMYDRNHLLPTFKLVEGKPGSSFAIELAAKTGFDASLLNRVEELAGEGSGKTELLLAELDQRQTELDQLLASVKGKEQQLQSLLSEYELLKSKLEFKKSEIIKGAKEKAAKLLDDTNKRIEQTIKLIKESKADKEKTIQARTELKKFEKEKVKEVKEELIKSSEKLVATVPPRKPVTFLPGNLVKVAATGNTGEIMELKKGKALVAIGLVKTWLNMSELELATNETVKGNKKVEKSGFDWVKKQAEFTPVLDLRGMLAEEAMGRLSDFLENAYMLGQFSLKIIHGRGEGILRKMVSEDLKSRPFVKSWKYEHADRGGDGATVVELM